ncbi:MAG TPA: TIGR00725 family protein, partial [candidate division Zixibacteria bacterium]|nr:TIGR00725 family protein [candidate division Zixibacteria bacterium]
MSPRAVQIAVIGAGDPEPATVEQARQVGRLLAERGATVVTGGLGGVMSAACEGAKAAGGRTLGILPGTDSATANRFCDVVVPTGFGEARNTLVVRSADALIALPGKYGTLSEIAFALVTGKPVVSLGSWEVSTEVSKAATPEEAVELAL